MHRRQVESSNNFVCTTRFLLSPFNFPTAAHFCFFYLYFLSPLLPLSSTSSAHYFISPTLLPTHLNTRFSTINMNTPSAPHSPRSETCLPEHMDISNTNIEEDWTPPTPVASPPQVASPPPVHATMSRPAAPIDPRIVGSYGSTLTFPLPVIPQFLHNHFTLCFLMVTD
jgi:hypothetical protein